MPPPSEERRRVLLCMADGCVALACWLFGLMTLGVHTIQLAVGACLLAVWLDDFRGPYHSAGCWRLGIVCHMVDGNHGPTLGSVWLERRKGSPSDVYAGDDHPRFARSFARAAGSL
jgi:hypothetical protein